MPRLSKDALNSRDYSVEISAVQRLLYRVVRDKRISGAEGETLSKAITDIVVLLSNVQVRKPATTG